MATNPALVKQEVKPEVKKVALSPAQVAAQKVELTLKEQQEAAAAARKKAGQEKKARYLVLLAEEKAAVQKNMGGWLACAFAHEDTFKGQPVPEVIRGIATGIQGLVEKLATDRAMERLNAKPKAVPAPAKK